MGSGPKRKENDQPIIRIPKVAAMGIPADLGEQAADLCKASFDVLVTNKAFAIKNETVELILNGNLYIISLAGTEIGKLTERQSTMVTKCIELGVKYKGKIIEDKGELYARFTRVA
jgi:hypothetical protein